MFATYAHAHIVEFYRRKHARAIHLGQRGAAAGFFRMLGVYEQTI